MGVVITGEQRNKAGTVIREASQQDGYFFAVLILFLMIPDTLEGFFLKMKMKFPQSRKWSDFQHGLAPFK